jgi:hypothetical protein
VLYYYDDNADGVFDAILPYSKESHVEAVIGAMPNSSVEVAGQITIRRASSCPPPTRRGS